MADDQFHSKEKHTKEQIAAGPCNIGADVGDLMDRVAALEVALAKLEKKVG